MTFPLERPARLAVFASGRGSNLRSLAAAFPPGDPLASVVLVLSNKPTAGALALAEAHGIPARAVPFGRDRDRFEGEADVLLEAFAVDLICLAGFMRVLSPAFTARYAGRILNVHPSLLPAFPGLHAQRQALAAGVSESGCTVHFVDAGVDTGAAIVQRRVPVLPEDTEDTLAERILREEHRAYPEAVRRVLKGQARGARRETGVVSV
jgi:phosphoribosylglycinamide formyltransferase-1